MATKKRTASTLSLSDTEIAMLRMDALKLAQSIRSANNVNWNGMQQSAKLGYSAAQVIADAEALYGFVTGTTGP